MEKIEQIEIKSISSETGTPPVEAGTSQLLTPTETVITPLTTIEEDKSPVAQAVQKQIESGTIGNDGSTLIDRMDPSNGEDWYSLFQQKENGNVKKIRS